MADRGIRANAVAPGIVSVGLAKHQWDTDPSYRARAQKAIPLGEMQPLDSVANAFLFLCSSAADYMTGSVLLIDGDAVSTQWIDGSERTAIIIGKTQLQISNPRR